MDLMLEPVPGPRSVHPAATVVCKYQVGPIAAGRNASILSARNSTFKVTNMWMRRVPCFLMAMAPQGFAARLGIATGPDLARPAANTAPPGPRSRIACRVKSRSIRVIRRNFQAARLGAPCNCCGLPEAAGNARRVGRGGSVRRLSCVAAAVSLAAGIGTASPAFAQSAASKAEYSLFDPVPDNDLRDMDTDRPNHTDTPHTVDAGHIQVELGLADFTRQWSGDPGDFTGFSTGQFNIRLGLTNTIEFNAALDAFDWQHASQQKPANASGIGDVTVGGKINLWGDDGQDGVWATALAIKPQIKLPTAGSVLGNGHVEAYVEFPFLVNLPSDFHLGLQIVPGFVRNDPNTAYVGGMQQSISIDRTLVGSADVYLEYWSQEAAGHASRYLQTVDVGFTNPIGKNVVLDSGVFFGLNHASPSFEYLGGVSFRF